MQHFFFFLKFFWCHQTFSKKSSINHIDNNLLFWQPHFQFKTIRPSLKCRYKLNNILNFEHNFISQMTSSSRSIESFEWILMHKKWRDFDWITRFSSILKGDEMRLFFFKVKKEKIKRICNKNNFFQIFINFFSFFLLK